jgi:hypothetical protein
MEFLFEIVLQFLGEIMLQIFLECIFEIGFHSVSNTIKTPKNTFWAAIGFVLWGVIGGGISLLTFPKSMIHNRDFRAVALIAIPLVAGFCMTILGKIRSSKGQGIIRMDRFFYAFVFAFTMALVRFRFAA